MLCSTAAFNTHTELRCPSQVAAKVTAQAPFEHPERLLQIQIPIRKNVDRLPRLSRFDTSKLASLSELWTNCKAFQQVVHRVVVARQRRTEIGEWQRDKAYREGISRARENASSTDLGMSFDSSERYFQSVALS